jgi:hypothetical protein
MIEILQDGMHKTGLMMSLSYHLSLWESYYMTQEGFHQYPSVDQYSDTRFLTTVEPVAGVSMTQPDTTLSFTLGVLEVTCGGGTNGYYCLLDRLQPVLGRFQAYVSPVPIFRNGTNTFCSGMSSHSNTTKYNFHHDEHSYRFRSSCRFGFCFRPC